MKIVFVQRTTQSEGGSRMSLFETVQALRAHVPGFSGKLVCHRAPGPFAQRCRGQGVEPVPLYLPRWRKIMERLLLPGTVLAARRRLRGFRPQVILSNEMATAPHAAVLGRVLQCPAASFVRDFEAIKRWRPYRLHKMDRVLCVCGEMKSGLVQAGMDAQKLRVVYNPVTSPAARKTSGGLPEGMDEFPHVRRWLLYPGKICRRKNQTDALKTLRALMDKTGEPWGLILAGQTDAEYEEPLRQAAATLKLNGHVWRTGHTLCMDGLLEMAEAVVMTSRREGLPRVLIESFLAGKPAFALPVAGIGDIYGEHRPVFVAREFRPEALADVLLNALKNQPAAARATAGLQRTLAERHNHRQHAKSLREALPDLAP